MNRLKLKQLIALSAGVLVVKSGVKWLKEKKKFRKLKIAQMNQSLIPTLMVHGTNGTRRSLGGMIERWTKNGLAYKAFDIEVAKNGGITLRGQWQANIKEKHPLVQIVFKDGDPTEWQQGAWLEAILALLQERIGIKEVNLLGHSMGGVAALRYLVDHGQDESLPKVKKVAIIGGPFNGEVVSSSGQTIFDLSVTGPKAVYETYRYLFAYRQGLPKTLKVFNIYGDLKNGSRSDGLVSVDSAKALRFIVKDQVASYREHLLVGPGAQHSLLHENQQVDRLVSHFLWR